MQNQAKHSPQSAIIDHPLFIGSLIILIVNDQFLKAAFPGWLTGKLSDAAGLVMLPMLLSALFPRFGKWSVVIPGLIFLWWKLPLSQPVIIFFNTKLHLPLNRVVDYTDLFALSLLPIAWLGIVYAKRSNFSYLMPAQLRLLLLITGGVACVATSMPRSMRYQQDGTLIIDKTYKLKISKAEALEKIKAEGLNVTKDTTLYLTAIPDSYQINNIVLNNGKDTLDYIRFNFTGKDPNSKIHVRSIKVRHPLSNQAVAWLKRHYRKIIADGLVEEIKN